jgi:hypothetical protein
MKMIRPLRKETLGTGSHFAVVIAKLTPVSNVFVIGIEIPKITSVAGGMVIRIVTVGAR